jgi:hypothetical protein
MKLITFKIPLILLYQVLSLKYQAKSPTDLPINSKVDTDQSNPVVTTLSNGYFVIVWDSDQVDSGYNVRAQMFNSNLDRVKDEIRLGSTSRDVMQPFVIDLKSKSRMVFLWQDRVTDDINFKIYDYSGAPWSNDIKANINSSQYNILYSNLRVAATSAGNFLITWQVVALTSPYLDVRGRLFDSDGKPLTDDFRVSSLNGEIQGSSCVCSLTNDNFVVTYDHALTGQSVNSDVYF